MTRCPLAQRGVDEQAACPGFELEVKSVSDGPGSGITVSCCRYIAGGSSPRGFSAACHHSDAEVVTLAARWLAGAVPERPTIHLVGRGALSGSSRRVLTGEHSGRRPGDR